MTMVQPSMQDHAERTAGHGWFNPQAAVVVTPSHRYGPFDGAAKAHEWAERNLQESYGVEP
jgi:hypothetical protein